MDQPVFVARLFKNDKNSRSAKMIYGLLVLIIALLITIVVTESHTVQWICGGVLLVALIVIGLSKKLSFNEPDDKNIYISREGIAIGMERFDWAVIDKLGIYVDAFYGFRFSDSGSTRNSPSSSYGMDNEIYFRCGDKKYSYRFLIPNHQSYFLLEDILAAWQADGRRFAWKEVYGRQFIEQQMRRWSSSN
ncbi:MAG: hypothetical protein JST39_24895 [Bacteroidetes bacterium]|nr:hypothetical protein [Bacteroidota bacterium]